MRGVRLVAAAAWLAVAAGGGRAADDAYDLRGPAPVKGQTLVSKSSLVLKDADVTLTVMGNKLAVKQTMTVTGEEEEKYLAVEGRQVTKSRAKITKDHTKTVVTLGGQDQTDEKDGDLAGEVVVSERTGDGKWKHALVDSRPTDGQKKELDKRLGPESDDDLYPEGKVKVGHAWEVDGAKMRKFFGKSFTDVTGTVKQKFVRVEDVNGEACAVVEAAGPVKGTMKDDDGDLKFEMELKATTWRSLRTGVAVKEAIGGRMRMSGTQKIDDTPTALVLEGTLKGEGTAALK